MPPQLVSLTDGPNILLDKPILLVGRHQECDIQIPSRKISRRHCCIAQVHDHLVVRDLGSTNGIRVNGQRVNEGQLRGGDELIIGNYKYQVRLGNGQPLPPAKGEPEKKPAAGSPPNDSWEEPVALSESGIAPDVVFPGTFPAAILPSNISHPPQAAPQAAPPQAAPPAGAEKSEQRLPNLDPSLAIPGESMSLEPLSDKYPQPRPPAQE